MSLDPANHRVSYSVAGVVIPEELAKVNAPTVFKMRLGLGGVELLKQAYSWE